MSETEKKTKKKLSLGQKLFRIILTFSLTLIAVGAAFGFFLFHNFSEEAYAKIAYIAGADASDMYTDYISDEFMPKLIERYESLPEASFTNGRDETYLANYADLYADEAYQEYLRQFKYLDDVRDVSGIFMTALDDRKGRMIYIADSHTEENRYHPPGFYRDMDANAVWASAYQKTDVSYFVLETETRGKMLISWLSVDYYKDNYDILMMVEVDMNAIRERGYTFLVQYIIVILLLTLLLDWYIVRRVNRGVSKPLDTMADAARTYAAFQDAGDQESAAFSTLDIHTGDEIEELSDTLKTMEKQKAESVRNLMEVTKEQEHIRAELNVAAEIQNDALPSEFPPFPEKTEFEIYATMDPAKEVGGDFYDFMLLDDDHLMMCIADVAGKGIPGALFMMTSKSVLESLVRENYADPAAVFAKANEQLCRNNTANMFVTVWMGILELSSGRLVCSNAGHEYPAILHQGGDFELLKDKHSLPLASFEGTRFSSYEIQLEPGDAVYVYTDGVAESNNTDEELFGTDRMLKALNRSRDAGMRELLLSVALAVREFSAGTEQFDDITMLGLRYFGPQEEEE